MKLKQYAAERPYVAALRSWLVVHALRRHVLRRADKVLVVRAPGMTCLESSPELRIAQVIRRAHVNKHDVFLVNVREEHVLRFDVSVDQVQFMHFLHLQANILEH